MPKKVASHNLRYFVNKPLAVILFMEVFFAILRQTYFGVGFFRWIDKCPPALSGRIPP